MAATNGSGIEAWLQTLLARTFESCARKRNGRTPRLQSGMAWRTFTPLLKGGSEVEILKLLGSLLRYANSDQSEAARFLFRAYIPLSLEHDAFGEFIGTDTLAELSAPRDGLVLARRTLRRWCEWLESLAHWQVYVSFESGLRPQSTVDKAVILLWPLARRYSWNGQNLLEVLCLTLRQPPAKLYASANELLSRLRGLGLGKLNGRSTGDPALTGYSIALRYSQLWVI